ncbi:MAG: AAA family ATPase [Abditibacteriota bacterium]|nr:AAA family ATPase [Abditibacteriota bacterium]
MSEEYTQLDYEKGAVGATFANWNEAREYRGRLRVEDFGDRDCAASWSLFLKVETLDEYLSRLGQSKLVAFVTACSDGMLAMAPSLLPWVMDKVRSGGMKRRMREGVRDIFQRDGDLLDELGGLVDRERKQLGSGDDKGLPARLYQAVMDDVTDNDLSRRLYTGINPMDTLLGGLRLGNVSILGAEPSTGKTALALNIAMNALSRGRKVLFFSLEMSDVQLMERLVAATGKLDYDSIANKHLDSAGQKLFADTALSLLKDGRLYIWDTVYFVEQMAERIVALKPDLVLVDFLQFCRTGWQANSTADRLEYIVSEFKRVAKLPYCQCHIMLLSQPSRQAGQEKQSMFALKGSSAIEQGGDVIMLLDRPAVRDIRQSPERASVKIAKNKFGRTGLIDLYFDGDHQRFREPRRGDSYTKIPTAEEAADRPW